jgi:hypothetical protein
MTAQEAYNKGLDVAENIAIDKLVNALEGNDVGPFNNPQMEEIRQKILFQKTLLQIPRIIPYNRDYNYILNHLKGELVEVDKLSDIDNSILNILKFCEEIVGPKPRSRVSVRAKQFLTNLKIDLLNNRDKLI